MGSVYIVLIFLNTTMVSFMFWLISFLYNLTSISLKNKNSVLVYECGFLTLSKFNLNLPMNSLILCMFMLIYEIEFMYSMPFFFNSFFYFFFSKIYFFIFLVFLLITICFDSFFKTTNWVY